MGYQNIPHAHQTHRQQHGKVKMIHWIPRRRASSFSRTIQMKRAARFHSRHKQTLQLIWKQYDRKNHHLRLPDCCELSPQSISLGHHNLFVLSSASVSLDCSLSLLNCKGWQTKWSGVKMDTPIWQPSWIATRTSWYIENLGFSTPGSCSEDKMNFV